MTLDNAAPAPVRPAERHVILDALRGFAILGICMANFPEFALYSFLSDTAVADFSTARIDWFTRYFLYIFIDGKFYTIFSLLFGIGFSIIISNAARRGADGLRIFYRRMFFLLIIGFIHLMTVWSGDILMLYAAVGMLLPLFIKLSDRAILSWAAFFLFLPVIIDSFCEIMGIDLSAAIVGWQWYYCDRFGITEQNFAYWLRDASDYGDVFKFLVQGAIVRLQEFVDGNRYFKVLGLFLIGYWIGRHRVYADLQRWRPLLRKVFFCGLFIGMPLTFVYAWSAMNSHPLGAAIHSLLYFSSVYLTSFGYIAAFVLIYLRFRNGRLWKTLAFPGRMALTCYIGQSVAGMFIFYGIGLGLGASVGLIFVECIAVGVFICEIGLSSLWLALFRFGPLEWIWRSLTYGRFFPILR